MDKPPPNFEQRELERLRASLYEWHFKDLRAAVEMGRPRLAFLGLAAWIDTISLVYTGGKGKGYDAWAAFLRKYVPRYGADRESVETLEEGLRNPMLHAYGTKGVGLTHENPDSHWELVGGVRVLNINVLLDEFEEAFEKYFADLQRDPELRYRALKRTPGLLSPVLISPHGIAPAQSVSASPTPNPDMNMIELPDWARRTKQ